MGDILHALPAITGLRQAHPQWIIDWVVEPRWQGLLAAAGSTGRDTGHAQARQPLVDRIYPAAARRWSRSPLGRETRSEITTLRRDLRESRYDAVLDLQGAVRSAAVARLTGCRRLIGEDTPREPAARWLFTERIRTSGCHVIEQDIELAAAVAGDQLRPVAPWLPRDAEAEAWAADLLARGTGPAVLINPGAGWGAKRWPAERYAEVAGRLLAEGCRVLVNLGPGERPLAEVILDETGGAAIPVNTSLEHLIAITRHVQLVIAGDTGPLHLACALGRPVVGIYGPTDPARNGPFGTLSRVLRHPQSRRDHTRREAPEAGLLTIGPEEVFEGARELLDAGRDR